MTKSSLRIWKALALAGLLFGTTGTLHGQAGDNQSVQKDTVSFARRFIHRVGMEGRMGYIFPTNSFLKGENIKGLPLRNTWAGHLKYSFRFRPDSQAAQAYLGAYQGIGVGYFDFGNRQELGSPVAVYVFQGGEVARLLPRLSLNYEWNFGASFGWHPYNQTFNSYNHVIGSKANAYLNAGIYLNWALSPHFDLHIGATGTHFSNGNTRYPNAGLNTMDCQIGLVYNFNRTADELILPWQRPAVPPFMRHMSYDLTLFGSWRRKAVDVPGGQVPAPGTYAVGGFNFAPMYNLGYKFRAGVSLDGVYDASANISSDDNGEEFTEASFGQKIALGVSARGEFVMPYFSIGIGLGANILHGGGHFKCFYQILTLKTDLGNNLYLHTGYNLRDFHDPNYLMLGIGYRFNDLRPRIRN